MMADETSSSYSPAARRSVTLPLRVSEGSPGRLGNISSGPDPQVETLFEHPSVRIVAFTTNSIAGGRPDLVQGGEEVEEEEAGTLPWTSSSERTIAVGTLRIYRAPGSVAFLNCGNVVQAILPKSRCWCVDNDSSKFVLQKRRPQYWRIEVPVANAAEKIKIQGFRDVLSQILMFEKTVCPFQRSFTVALPDGPRTPMKKRPWRPVERFTPESQSHSTSPLAPEEAGGEDYYSALSDDNQGRNETNSDSDATDDTDATPRHLSSEVDGDRAAFSTPLQANRSVTLPAQLAIVTSSPSKADKIRSPVTSNTTVESDSTGFSSSVESFHSVQSWHSPIIPLPPSPPLSNPGSPTMYPYPHDNITLPKRLNHSRHISEITIGAETTQAVKSINTTHSRTNSDGSGLSSPTSPDTPALIDDIEENADEEQSEISTPPKVKKSVRHRPTTGSNSRRRELSPLPPAANLFSPPRRQRRPKSARHFSTVILQKTYEILLSPPSHLLHLMLEMASRIVAGEWRGLVFGFGESGERIVGQWDHDEGEATGDGWGEDDDGIDLGGPSQVRRRTARTGGSWEID